LKKQVKKISGDQKKVRVIKSINNKGSIDKSKNTNNVIINNVTLIGCEKDMDEIQNINN